MSAVRELRPPQRGPTRRETEMLELAHYRLASFSLALDAVLPELGFIDQAVQTTAMGLPLSPGGAHRLHKIALKLHDLRAVLEWPMPEIER